MKKFSFGPAYISNVAANILNPPTGAGGAGITATNQFMWVTHLRVSNKTGVAATFTLYKGATGGSAGGTEITGLSESVPANSHVDIFVPFRLDVADFLTGVASAASTLTISGGGLIGVAG